MKQILLGLSHIPGQVTRLFPEGKKTNKKKSLTGEEVGKKKIHVPFSAIGPSLEAALVCCLFPDEDITRT